MDKPYHKIFHVIDRTYQSLARVQLKEMATEAGFTGHRLGEIEIIIGEITSNLSKHTTEGGSVFCLIGDDPKRPLIEFIAIDNGPGIRSPMSMMIDGVSTKKTLGHGLGAIKRLSSEFDIYSLPGWGTILFSRNYKNKTTIPQYPMNMEVLRLAKDGEIACGDNWHFKVKGKKIQAAIIDGLGHGPEASAAALKAIETIGQSQFETPEQQLRSIHDSLKRSRGVVMTIVQLDIQNRQASYCGVGNIGSRILPRSFETRGKTFSPYNGILGHTLPNSVNNNFTHLDPKTDMLIMHSDGLSSRWDLSRYPKINQHHSMILCAALYKDYNRGNDDTTIAIIK